MRFCRCILLTTVFLALGAGASGVGTSEVLVKFKAGTPGGLINRHRAVCGIVESRRSSYTGVTVMTVPQGRSESDLLDYFSRRAEVEYAEPNGILTQSFIPNDPYYTDSRELQWNLNRIGMPAAWDLNQGGSPSTIIAVIDSGVAYENHGAYKQAPDLAGTSFVAGYDFVNDDDHPNDDDSHGTHVTGTIAQTTNNAYGTAGIAFNCSIMPLKALDATGSGTVDDVADAIVYAADHGANVVNMSLGGPTPYATIESALTYAYNKGVTLVAATGNDNEIGISAVDYPARYSTTIAVGATRWDDAVAWYSNKGPQLDLVAPGGDMDVDQNGDDYGDGILQNVFNPITKRYNDFGFWFFQGTSMATPHVTAVAALLYEQVGARPEIIRTILRSTATDLGMAGFDEESGWGLLDAEAALALAEEFPKAGDADADGVIDGVDLAIWQENYDPLGLNDNNTFAMGDWDGDGDIDGADLALWQENYAPLGYLGQADVGTLSLATQMVPTPEPATAALFLAGSGLLLVLRRRSRS